MLTPSDNLVENDRSARENTVLPYVYRNIQPESSTSTVVCVEPKPTIGTLNEITTEHKHASILTSILEFAG